MNHKMKKAHQAGVALFLIAAALGIVFVHREVSRKLNINLGTENNDYFMLPNDSVGAGVMLNVEKVCPRSSVINTVNNNLPPPKLMPLDQVQGIVISIGMKSTVRKRTRASFTQLVNICCILQ
jgi:hypothetical protein